MGLLFDDRILITVLMIDVTSRVAVAVVVAVVVVVIVVVVVAVVAAAAVAVVVRNVHYYFKNS